MKLRIQQIVFGAVAASWLPLILLGAVFAQSDRAQPWGRRLGPWLAILLAVLFNAVLTYVRIQDQRTRHAKANHEANAGVKLSQAVEWAALIGGAVIVLAGVYLLIRFA